MQFRVAVGVSVMTAAMVGACGGSDAVDDPVLEPTYANVEQTIRTSCAFQESCHGGSGNGKARLNFARLLAAGTPITEALVGVDACEYDFMPRVDPGNPEGSWLWIKVAGAHDASGFLTFTPDPAWDPELSRNSSGELRPSTCPLVVDGEISFGEIMPQTSETGLGPNAVELFRQWILAGAPGPQ